MDFAHVALDHLITGNMLEHDRREREVEHTVSKHCQILPVILIDERVRTVGQRGPRFAHHLAADVDRVYFAEQPRQRARNPARPAADLQHSHLLRLFALADVDHVRENLFLHGLLAGAEEFVVAPFLLARHHVVAGVLPRALVPIAAHLFELFVQIEIAHHVIL